jgi:NTE family protein
MIPIEVDPLAQSTPLATERRASQPFRTVLVFGGGNALGAYHAGVYEALHERGVEPEWVIGASIGSVVGAIIAGNQRDHRLPRLRELWRPEPGDGGLLDPWAFVPDSMRRSSEVVKTLLAGRPGMFAPIGPLGSWWTADPRAGAPALYDTQMLDATLASLIDFDRLNSGVIRFTATAVSLENGEDVAFDTLRQRVEPIHLRASSALLTTFPAVEIDGGLFVDGGLSANLPLDPVLDEPAERPTLVIASDLLPLRAPRPDTLGEVIGRMQDLTFAAQSRRTIRRWRSEYGRREALGEAGGGVTLVRLAYSDQEREVAGKAMDFSPRSVSERWASGKRDATAMLDRIAAGEIVPDAPGLTIY